MVFIPVVIPAKAGIHFDFAVGFRLSLSALREIRLTSVCGMSAIPGGQSLSVTPGILPSALRAGFAVRAAPAAQCLCKRK